MFIVPNKLKSNFTTSKKEHSAVRLQSSHLLIDHEVANELFEQARKI